MEVSCPECGNRVLSEEVPVAVRYGIWARIDDEQRSDSYAEHLLGGVRSALG
jgi:hypothetical protein